MLHCFSVEGQPATDSQIMKKFNQLKAWYAARKENLDNRIIFRLIQFIFARPYTTPIPAKTLRLYQGFVNYPDSSSVRHF